MKTSAQISALVLASLCASAAFAQSKGEADPAQSMALPTAPATAAEKAEARKARKASGKEIARTTSDADDTPKSMGARGVSKTEKAEAAAKRRAAAAAATKNRETTSGEK